MASKSSSPVGVHFPKQEKALLLDKVNSLDVSASSYIRDLVYIDLGLKENDEVLSLKEEINNLKKENQRLLYEGNFKPQYELLSDSFKYKDIEVMNPMDIPYELKIVELV